MTSSCRNRYRRLTTNENGRSKLTEAYFKNQFREEGIDVSKIKPTPMKQPFTQKKNTCDYLSKNNKNTWRYGKIAAASLKKSLYIAHSMIAKIYSEITAAGDGLVEWILGILNAMQKSICFFFHFSFVDTVSSDTLIIENYIISLLCKYQKDYHKINQYNQHTEQKCLVSCSDKINFLKLSYQN